MSQPEHFHIEARVRWAGLLELATAIRVDYHEDHTLEQNIESAKKHIIYEVERYFAAAAVESFKAHLARTSEAP